MKLFADIREKKIIMITESQALDLLFEAATIQDIYQKYYSHIPQETFQQIISADPTYDVQKSNKMGKFGKWLLTLFQKNRLKLEDLYKATDYLSVFMHYKGRIPKNDITSYNSLQELYETIKPFLDNPQQAANKSEEIRNVKKDAEKVYEDEKWLVIVPHTQEASCYYGKGTQWCTAADHSQNAFNSYNERGLLYINIVKGTNTKYQFHFETGSFMDATDTPIEQPIANTIGLSTDLINFYADKYKVLSIPLTSEYVLEDMFKVKGLDDYYIGSELLDLLKYNEQTRQMETLCKLDGRYGEEFCVVAKLGRFIPINTFNKYVNLFDIQENRLLLDQDTYEYFDINGDNLIVHFENKEKGIYSLKEMRYTTTSLPQNCIINRINARYPDFKPYPNDIAIITIPERGYAPFSFSKGNIISSDFYRTTKKVEFYVTNNGKTQILSFVSFIKGGDEYHDADVLLYDGALVPMPQLSQNTEQILSQHHI